MKGADISWWSVGRGSWWIQSRAPKASSYLRRLRSARRAGYAVQGDHLTIYAVDCSSRKLRGILTKIQNLTDGHFASHELDEKAAGEAAQP
jgi:hypothetical protein